MAWRSSPRRPTHGSVTIGVPLNYI